MDQAVGEGVSFTIDLGFEDADEIQQIWARVSCARNAQLKLELKVRAPQAVELVANKSVRSSLVTKQLTEFLVDHAPLAVLVPPFYGTVRDEELRSRAVIDRLLGSGDQSHVVRNLVSSLELDQFEQLNAYLQDVLGVRLTYRTSGDRLQTESPLVVQFKDSDGDIELSAAGAGLVNLISLYTALSRWRHESARRRVIFLLDEPEAHLHPRLQAESAERLGRLVVDQYGAQLILATHSVDILNRLSTSGALLVRCDRTAEPSAVPLDSDTKLFDDLADWVDLTPYTAINFLASRRVLFCEGPGDKALLQRFGELRYRNDPKQAERFRRWAIVQLDSASKAPIADLLGRLLQSDAIKAKAKGGGFQVEVVLDRDHGRQPGIQTQATGDVTTTTTVWSHHSIESLLLEPALLALWVRARVGPAAPPDLVERIGAALKAANSDAALNDAAVVQLSAKLALGDLEDKDGKPVGGEQKFIRAQTLARERLNAEPWVWQRGKDRARFVLGRIRESLPPAAKNQFPTDVIALIKKASLNLISDPNEAIPAEVVSLLDRLVTP